MWQGTQLCHSSSPYPGRTAENQVENQRLLGPGHPGGFSYCGRSRYPGDARRRDVLPDLTWASPRAVGCPRLPDPRSTQQADAYKGKCSTKLWSSCQQTQLFLTSMFVKKRRDGKCSFLAWTPQSGLVK